ncbi:zinc dependent phospholipase C family protein [Virgibacillus sp. W0430]|uniref:zinc dependent phospholipase C family protein n=1 Tax=Virgibacillus sp. W0430 TaxID=3391580 RepID=UPI003F479593
MPNIWTHIQFCEDVIDSIQSMYPKVPQQEPYLKLGAQGPDPFFYYNFWPWKQKGIVQTIGTKLHTEQCGDFLINLIDQAKNMNNNVQAYVFGFATHHILDRHTHPYVHYFAGYNGNNHQRLEVIIDTIFMGKYHHLHTWKIPVFKEINAGRSLDKNIVHLLHTTINNHYPEVYQQKENYIHKSYRDMKLALKILADPYGWKNKLLGTIVSPFSHQPIKNELDYLNLAHDTWYHSATKEPSTKSFVDLYKEAKVEGIELMNHVLTYWEKSEPASRKRITEIIGNISYDTGLPLRNALENKYCDPIV